MRCIPRFALRALASLFGIGSAWACTQPLSNTFWWANCVDVNVYLDSSLSTLPVGPGDSPATQIASAVATWSTSIPPLYPFVSINVETTGDPDWTVMFQAGALAGGIGASQPIAYGEIASQIVTVNTQFSFADPTQSAYQTLWYKIALHELGHIFGLADVYQPYPCNSYPLMSVMDQVCGTNDSGQGIAFSPTTCDTTEVETVYAADYPGGSCTEGGGDCGGGGGGGGGCIPDGEECTDDPYDCCSEACNGGICSDVDPVIIDLSGRGYQLTSATDGVQFDFYGTGVPTQMSWTAAGWDGGFLALDRNGNGRIDDGAELFSNLSPQPTPKSGNKNGFLALAVYDLPVNGGNGDGWIDDQDAIYSKLLIWVDRNHNGISDPGELLTLKQAGILRISLTYAPSPWTDAFGNKFRYRAQMITTAAANQVVYDVLLQEAAHVPGSTVSTKVL
jgi:hypothetical protein